MADPDAAALRAQVLGEIHTSSAVSDGDPMSADFVALAERNVWAGVWVRPGLHARERNLSTINLLIAGGHADELELHFRGALRNGWWTADQLFEVCLHSTAYCGFPAARAAFQALMRVLRTDEGVTTP